MTLLTSSTRTPSIPGSGLGFPSLGTSGGLAQPHISFGDGLGEGLQVLGRSISDYAEARIDMDRRIDFIESRTAYNRLAADYAEEAMKAERGKEDLQFQMLAAEGRTKFVEDTNDKYKLKQREMLWSDIMSSTRTSLKGRINQKMKDHAEVALKDNAQELYVSMAAGMPVEQAIAAYEGVLGGLEPLLGEKRVANLADSFKADAYRQRFEYLLGQQDPESAIELMKNEGSIKALTPDERRWRTERAEKEYETVSVVDRSIDQLLSGKVDNRLWPKDDLTNNRIVNELLSRGGLSPSHIAALFAEQKLLIPTVITDTMDKSFERGDPATGIAILEAVERYDPGLAKRMALYSKQAGMADVALTMRKFVDGEVLIGTLREGGRLVPEAMNIMTDPDVFDPFKLVNDGMVLDDLELAANPGLQHAFRIAYLYEFMRNGGNDAKAREDAINWMGTMLVYLDGQYGNSTLFGVGSISQPKTTANDLIYAIRDATQEFWKVEDIPGAGTVSGLRTIYRPAVSDAFQLDDKVYIPYGDESGAKGFIEWNPVTKVSRNISRYEHGPLFAKVAHGYESFGYSEEFNPVAWLRNKPEYGVKTVRELSEKYHFDAESYILRHANRVWHETVGGTFIDSDDEETRTLYSNHCRRIMRDVFGYSDWE